MKKKTITMLIIILNLLCFSQFSGGSGTIEDPYQIATAEDLNNIRNYMTSSFIQTADIDLGVPPWNEGEGWDPIGDYDPFDPSRSFRGNYDGDSYKILSMYINRPGESQLGLFGSTLGCVFEEIVLTNILITGYGSIGGISGISYNDSINNCAIIGRIDAQASDIGLLCGFFEGIAIENCHVTGEIFSTAGWIGGLVGICSSLLIRNCSSVVTITCGGWTVGGLTGICIDTILIEECFSICNITTTKNLSGGFIGTITSANIIIRDCYSKGILKTEGTNGGGFIGSVSLNQDTLDNLLISNCFSNVNIDGNDIIGGFIGRIVDATAIGNCYSTGQITGNTNVGGFIGSIDSLNTVTVTNSYWDTETSGIDSSAAGEGRTTAEMTFPYSSNTYIGWDFDTAWRDDVANQNDGYPTFLWVSGIEDDHDILPETATLYQNYPNPFNPVTQIKFALAKTAEVKLSVYNISGQKVAELLNGMQNAGIHSVNFDGSRLNSGIYYYTLEVDGKSMTKRMLMVK